MSKTRLMAVLVVGVAVSLALAAPALAQPPSAAQTVVSQVRVPCTKVYSSSRCSSLASTAAQCVGRVNGVSSCGGMSSTQAANILYHARYGYGIDWASCVNGRCRATIEGGLASVSIDVQSGSPMHANPYYSTGSSSAYGTHYGSTYGYSGSSYANPYYSTGSSLWHALRIDLLDRERIDLRVLREQLRESLLLDGKQLRLWHALRLDLLDRERIDLRVLREQLRESLLLDGKHAVTPHRSRNPRRIVMAAPQLDRAWMPWRLRTCEVGTANINVSLLFGSASLVFLGLVYVMPSWAAGAIACCGLLVAALLVDRQETGCWWTLDHALDPVDWLEPELDFNLSCARCDRIVGSAPAPPVEVATAAEPTLPRSPVRPIPARVLRPASTAALADRSTA